MTDEELLGRIEGLETALGGGEEILSLITISILNLNTGKTESSLHEIVSMIPNEDQTEVVMYLTQVGTGERSKITIEELKESE